jgi:hypothetical protein
MASTETQGMEVLVTQVAVTSETHPYETYLVQLPYCPCKDFRYRRARLLAGVPGMQLQDVFCKHLLKGLALVGGWHETPEPAPEQVTHHRLTRDAAVTLLTSAYLASDLVDRLLRAAVGANGMAVTVRITNGDVLVKYESTARRYTVTLPSSQPVALPPNWRDAEPEPRVHEDLSRERAVTLLAEAGLDSAKVRSVLTSIRVLRGRDTLALPDGGEAVVTYNLGTRRYDVTLPAKTGVHSGQSRANAYDLLTEAGVTGDEARRALREAGRTGRAFAGLPGSGSIPVKHEAGVAGGGFTIELPA